MNEIHLTVNEQHPIATTHQKVIVAMMTSLETSSRACDVISRTALRPTSLGRQTDRRRSHERAKFRIFQISPLLAEIRPILWSEVNSLTIWIVLCKFKHRNVQGIWRRFYHTIIYHQFLRVRVREEPHWQGASYNSPIKSIFRHPGHFYLKDFSEKGEITITCNTWSAKQSFLAHLCICIALKNLSGGFDMFFFNLHLEWRKKYMHNVM